MQQVLTMEPSPEPVQNESQTDCQTSIEKHDLDSKIIRQLEMNILKTMSGNAFIDPLFSSGVPETTLQSTTIGSSSLSLTQSSFTMESVTVDSISTTVDQEENSNNAEKKKCCSTKSSSNQEVAQPSVAGANQNPQLLPPQRSEDKGKITLVLDLDETLIHSSFLSIPHADFRFILGIDNGKVGLNVCVRPGCNKFLQELGSLYEIVIFTASCQIYADAVIDFIDPGKVVRHRLYRESCSDFGGNFVKDLTRLNRPLERIIIIDNASVSYMLQPYNAIAISSWFDDPTDNELFIILDFLKRNHRVKNIYDILCSKE